MKIKYAISDNKISWANFFNTLSNLEIGCWDNVNPTYIIEEYIEKMHMIGVNVGHIEEALATQSPEHEHWMIWLGNSMETPFPINTKQDLVDALELTDEDLEQELDFSNF